MRNDHIPSISTMPLNIFPDYRSNAGVYLKTDRRQIKPSINLQSSCMILRAVLECAHICTCINCLRNNMAGCFPDFSAFCKC